MLFDQLDNLWLWIIDDLLFKLMNKKISGYHIHELRFLFILLAEAYSLHDIISKGRLSFSHKASFDINPDIVDFFEAGDLSWMLNDFLSSENFSFQRSKPWIGFLFFLLISFHFIDDLLQVFISWCMCANIVKHYVGFLLCSE